MYVCMYVRVFKYQYPRHQQYPDVTLLTTLVSSRARYVPGPSVGDAGEGDVTLIIEKLEGDCLRCRVPATAEETVTFHLVGALSGIKSLHVWQSNASVQVSFVNPLSVLVRSRTEHGPLLSKSRQSNGIHEPKPSGYRN